MNWGAASTAGAGDWLLQRSEGGPRKQAFSLQLRVFAGQGSSLAGTTSHLFDLKGEYVFFLPSVLAVGDVVR